MSSPFPEDGIFRNNKRCAPVRPGEPVCDSLSVISDAGKGLVPGTLNGQQTPAKKSVVICGSGTPF